MNQTFNSIFYIEMYISTYIIMYQNINIKNMYMYT